MTRGSCKDANCTFNLTKACVRGNPPDECPHRPLLTEDDLADDEEEREQADSDGAGSSLDVARRLEVGGAVLDAPTELPTLPPSRTLNLDKANAMMGARQTCMIGIVGLPGAGKTACLVSAYLLLAKGEFEGFSFADSMTLRAFEEIARGSRMWVKGNPPEQITAHTTLTDDREAGFLHLRLRRDRDGRLFDLLLPDLPGEWSKELIDLNNVTRLAFLKSSSVIWLMVDGRQFANDETVAYARYRASLLIERLADLLGEHRPGILLVPTWRDADVFPAAEVTGLAETAIRLGFEFEMAPIASFSSNDAISPGDGVAELMERSICPPKRAHAFWPATEAEQDDRALLMFRGRQ
ncbi:TRAFAC clade GTPase domain-containing protein [Burkholderia theae]|uniref:TRAFAC clade GTPase domain-containing protein n=1 Tax=Burkholderia theae TaxID=3143496 RepID=UPI003AFA5B54